jgi:hypothetical protein
MPQDPSPPPADGTVRVSHLSFSEMMNLTLQMRTRIAGEWQRVINAHAALVAVMVFFASQPEPFVAARLIVFGFYTVVMLTSIANLNESYRGLRLLIAELALFPKPALGGESVTWVRRKDLRADKRLRITMLFLIWVLVGYLLILPLFFGRHALV